MHYELHHIATQCDSESKVHGLLENRYKMLYGAITDEIQTLLINWR